ncbi:ABC transporter ATP-binding protein [Streptomyces lunaelactis]|uniref:ABC transporter ATP-binding protein n=1 Tax=Streptomyces lunaelactis TaxID=1535768 RepID=A0A2R4T768_9ACTN|nr:ABC transporter ATP-binding protein [Streptomyces lunaelactis]AVZ74968.1 ABC transporter ATP-binding protein [Streptomyces lunaelactis]NUK85249.1 ABC transporter ATP-binding protein [Streptomyces lunaelactis]
MSPPPTQSGSLRITDLHVTYGRSVRALHGVSLSVPQGGIVAVLGSNGAGKTTLLRAVSGTLALHRGTVDSGTVHFGETRLTGDPARSVAAGVVQVPEGRRIFGALSVEDNLRAGFLGARRRSGADRQAARDRVFALFPLLAERRRQAAGLLSGGEQQMLAMGRALMAAPRLLLLDEPSLGLAPLMVQRIASVIREINAQGTSILLVEQNASMGLALSDRASVLDVGQVRLEGASDDLAGTDEVRRLYLGESFEAGTAGQGAVSAATSATALSATAPGLTELARWKG